MSRIYDYFSVWHSARRLLMVESPGAGSMYLLVAMSLLYTYFILKIEHYFEKKFKQAARKSVPKGVFGWSE